MYFVNAIGIVDCFGLFGKAWDIINPVIDEHKATFLKDHPRYYTFFLVCVRGGNRHVSRNGRHPNS
jgi:hypothetical protein